MPAGTLVRISFRKMEIDGPRTIKRVLAVAGGVACRSIWVANLDTELHASYRSCECIFTSLCIWVSTHEAMAVYELWTR